MTVQIDFPAELEQQLQARAAAAGQDVSTIVRQIVADSLGNDEQVQSQSEMTKGHFAKRLDDWIALHPKLKQAIDDSRESIYAGRGE